MSKRYWSIAVSALLAISLAVGFTGCKRTADQLVKPMPISKTNTPWTFKVVGFKNGKPVLLTHEISLQLQRSRYDSDMELKQVIREFKLNVLWENTSKSSNQYSFYIDPKHKSEIERILTEPIKNDFKTVDITILRNKPETKSQTIRVDYKDNDDYFYSVYYVSNNRVTPLRCGDLTKHDFVVAVAVGIKWWFLTFVPGVVVFSVIKYWSCKRLQ